MKKKYNILNTEYWWVFAACIIFFITALCLYVYMYQIIFKSVINYADGTKQLLYGGEYNEGIALAFDFLAGMGIAVFFSAKSVFIELKLRNSKENRGEK